MKTAIVAYWKQSKLYEVYGSTVSFQEHNPQYIIDTLKYWITRNKLPFEDNKVIVRKVKYVERLGKNK